MSRGLFIFITLVCYFSCTTDTRLFLFHRGVIRYTLPTEQELQSDYQRNKEDLDSLISYCDLLYNSKQIREYCLSTFEIIKIKGRISFYPGRKFDSDCVMKDSMVYKNYDLNILLENSEIKSFFSKISSLYDKVCIPKGARITCSKKFISIPRNLAMINYTDSFYVSFFYLQDASAKKIFQVKDSIDVSYFTNRSEFLLK